MAIDIKSLRIGSHILVDGVRARVSKIINPPLERVMPGIGLLHFNTVIDGNICECSCPVCADGIEPIAITPELLKELGLKYRTPICIWIKASEDEYLSFERICGINRWRIHIYIGNEDRGKCVCRYLHEAEAFLALHGIELIPD